MQRILYETGSTGYLSFLSGSNSFRKELNPEYKANRKDRIEPEYLQPVREHLVVGWQSTIADYVEADDELGIAQTQLDEPTIICSIDKDLLQVPGMHYNFVTGVFRTVTELEALHNFYYQIIMGDNSDNIKGFDGIGRAKVPKFLEPTISYLWSLTTEQDMYDFTRDLYQQHGMEDQYEMNAHCLYIHRKTGDKWHAPNESAIPLSNPV